VHRLRDALSRPILVVTVIAIAAGYGQFGAVAALGDVARTFGHAVQHASITEQAGLSGTVLGVGLAILRLASLGGLPLAALADRLGRHRTLISWTVLGLLATILAAVSPSYWWFVAIFALGRPFLSASAALSQVVVAELSRPDRRAMALAVVTGGYGLGAGINVLAHAALRGVAGFRVLFVTAAIPLALVVVLRKQFPEPTEPEQLEPEAKVRLGSVGSAHVVRLLEVLGLIFATSAVSSPASSFVYLYAENVVHLPKGIESAMITVSALFGLGGLLLGRVVADRFGRRPAVGIGITAVGLAALVVYSGGKPFVVVGYSVGILATGFLAPGGTALSNELFPTEIRASVAGWGIVAGVLGAVLGLVTFGALADSAHSFEVAALVTFLPIIPALFLLLRLPETKGAMLAGTLGAEDLSEA